VRFGSVGEVSGDVGSSTQLACFTQAEFESVAS